MNQKELGELRRRFKPERSAVSRIYGCYVNSQKEVISYLDESLGLMPQEEAEKYLSLLKRPSPALRAGTSSTSSSPRSRWRTATSTACSPPCGSRS